MEASWQSGVRPAASVPTRFRAACMPHGRHCRKTPAPFRASMIIPWLTALRLAPWRIAVPHAFLTSTPSFVALLFALLAFLARVRTDCRCSLRPDRADHRSLVRIPTSVKLIWGGGSKHPPGVSC